VIRILVFLVCFSNVQTEKSVIEWQDDRKLTWKDFIGKPKLNSRAVAETASGISFGFSVKTTNSNIDSFSTEVNTYFYPEDSWYNVNKADAYILRHEQLHFDITELYARKLRKEISELKVSNQVRTALKAIYKNNETELAKKQNRYDLETNHSKNIENQKKWQEYVKAELDKLTKYKN
jgi:FtsZ-binding cell division protein ZapB